MYESHRVGRRGILALAGGAALLAGAVPARAGARTVQLDFSSAADRLRAYMLMRGALDDRLVIGCFHGQYYGVVDAVMTPLFDVVSATFSRYRLLPGGAYLLVNVEYAYFVDSRTGTVLDSYRNPYTGQDVTVPGGGFKPAALTITPDLQLKLDKSLPGMEFDHRIGAPEVRGNDVWITDTTHTSRTAQGATRPFCYSEVVTMHARRDELETGGARRVSCETGFTNIVSWRPWLNMGDRPGHMMAIGAGHYGGTIEELPAPWLAAARARRPEVLADPAAVLAPLWNANAA